MSGNYYKGIKPHRFYHIFQNMHNRCYDTKAVNYARYGGKGIRVCERWMTFDNFKADMFESYEQHVAEYGEKNTTLDRNGDSFTAEYSPENCRWATVDEQIANRELTVWLEVAGVRKTIVQWAKETGLTRVAISKRLKRGWSPEDAVSKPLRVTRLSASKGEG